MNKKCGIINVSAAVEMSQVTFKKERCYCFCVCELNTFLPKICIDCSESMDSRIAFSNAAEQCHLGHTDLQIPSGAVFFFSDRA